MADLNRFNGSFEPVSAYNGENAVDTVEIDYRPSFSPIVVDIDNDGTEEVIIGSEDGEVYLYKVPIVEHGTEIDEFDQVENWDPDISGWWLFGDNSAMFPTIADVNNDGLNDIVVTSGEGNIYTFIYSQGPSGENVWTKLDDELVLSSGTAFPSFIFKKDGSEDRFLIAGSLDGYVSLFKWDNLSWINTPLWNVEVSDTVITTPVIANIDNDPELEIYTIIDNNKLAVVNLDANMNHVDVEFRDKSIDFLGKNDYVRKNFKNNKSQLFLTANSEFNYLRKNDNDDIEKVVIGKFHHEVQPVFTSVNLVANPYSPVGTGIFSPNNDGEFDTISLKYSLVSRLLCNVKAEIFDSSDNLIITIHDVEHHSVIDNVITWDGKGSHVYNNAAFVGEGEYTIRLSADANSGEVVYEEVQVYVDLTPPVIFLIQTKQY